MRIWFAIFIALSQSDMSRAEAELTPKRLLKQESLVRATPKVGIADLVQRPTPFWRKKEKVLRRITVEKEIIVSAGVPSRSENGKTIYTMNMKAAGLVSVPLSFAEKQVWKFENLPKVNDSFKEVVFFPKQMRVFMHVSAYGFHARMVMELTKKVNESIHEIHWKNVEGSFKGMTGVVRLEKFARGKTLMSTDSVFISEKLPLPSALIGIGMEIVAKAAAGGMRSYLEDIYGQKL